MSSASSIDLMSKLAAHMNYATQRQAVLSQNIANIDTPNYISRDLKPLNFDEMVSSQSHPIGLATTSAKHISIPNGSGAFSAQEVRQTFETSPNGNNVGLEEEMAKISETGAQFQVSSSLFKKFTAMYRNAMGNR